MNVIRSHLVEEEEEEAAAVVRSNAEGVYSFTPCVSVTDSHFKTLRTDSAS